jgi:hypothetical protein
MAEQWKPVVGYESTYVVSDAGRVKRIESVVWNCKGYYLTRKERVLKPGNDKDGYQLIGLCQNGVRTTKKVHRLVLEAFVGPAPEGALTRHLNGDCRDNRLENLAWGTAAENAADMETHGTRRRGEAHHFYGRCGSNHWLANT